MAHDTHAADHHGDTHHAISNDSTTSKTALSSSLWVAVILVGLFIAAVNFVGVMSGDGHGEKEGAVQPTMEATANGTAAGETGVGKPVDSANTTQYHAEGHGTGSEAQTEGHGH